MESSHRISVSKAMEKFLCQTDILVPYKNGSMIELQRDGYDKNIRAIYKVIDGPISVIFKSITCKKGDNERIRQIKDEFMISIKAHEAAADGVVTPISMAEIDDKYLPHHVIEFVYEYGGEDLLTALKSANGKKIMEIMGSVVRIMAKLELKSIFHSDIKPQTIAVSNGAVKLISFGVSICFDSKDRMFSTQELRGGTLPYLPPEVVKNHRGIPTAVDVYCWEIGRAHV